MCRMTMSIPSMDRFRARQQAHTPKPTVWFARDQIALPSLTAGIFVQSLVQLSLGGIQFQRCRRRYRLIYTRNISRKAYSCWRRNATLPISAVLRHTMGLRCCLGQHHWASMPWRACLGHYDWRASITESTAIPTIRRLRQLGICSSQM